MKISFVIPAYNEEAVIAQCLESVQKEIARAKESYPDVEAEVVVVNNASTDTTRDVALAFSFARVVDEPVKGLVSARNAGFCATDGDLVANIDADVLVPAGWLSTVIRRFQKNPKMVALSGPYIYYDVSRFERFLVRLFYGLAYGIYVINHYVLRTGAMLQGGNFIIRRSAMEAAGGFDTSIAFYGEDTDVAKRLSRMGNVKWTFALPMCASGRRLKAEGLVRMSLKYSINYFWVTFFGRPFTLRYRDIRPE